MVGTAPWKNRQLLFKEEEEFFVRRLLVFDSTLFFCRLARFQRRRLFVSKKRKFWAGHLNLITHLDLKHLPFWKSLHMGCDVCLIESKRRRAVESDITLVSLIKKEKKRERERNEMHNLSNVGSKLGSFQSRICVSKKLFSPAATARINLPRARENTCSFL